MVEQSQNVVDGRFQHGMVFPFGHWQQPILVLFLNTNVWCSVVLGLRNYVFVRSYVRLFFI